MKVLINCYACSPYEGSEPGLGWDFVYVLSRLHDIHILTESRFQPDLERFFHEHPEEQSYFHFHFIKRERHHFLRKVWPPSYYWFYHIWQKKAFQYAVELNKKENFDIVHQLNMTGYREPGMLWKLKKPFVWGPIGGHNITPWRLLPSMGLYGAVFYAGRNVVNLWQMHYSLKVRKAIKHSSYIISATQDSFDVVTAIWKRPSIIIPEVGLKTFHPLGTKKCNQDKIKICWSGLHIVRKSLNLLIEALPLCRNKDRIECHVMGSGEKTEDWKNLAKKRGLKNIIWYGWQNREDATKVMNDCDMFVITSLSDETSTVLLEALSAGLPVITLDHCGFKNVVTEDCGRKIPVISKKQVILGISRAIDNLIDDEALRMKLSEGARKRALEYNWEDKARIITEIYETLSV